MAAAAALPATDADAKLPSGITDTSHPNTSAAGSPVSEVAAAAAAARQQLALAGAVDPPHPWVKKWSAETNGVVYENRGVFPPVTVASIGEVMKARLQRGRVDPNVAAALGLFKDEEPWLELVDRKTHRVISRHR